MYIYSSIINYEIGITFSACFEKNHRHILQLFVLWVKKSNRTTSNKYFTNIAQKIENPTFQKKFRDYMGKHTLAFSWQTLSLWNVIIHTSFTLRFTYSVLFIWYYLSFSYSVVQIREREDESNASEICYILTVNKKDLITFPGMNSKIQINLSFFHKPV